MSLRPLYAAVLLIPLLVGAAGAQGTDLTFGDGQATSDQPVEITADALDVNRDAGLATFTGNVVVTQGALRLTGATVNVVYGPGPDGQTDVQEVTAEGNVVLVNGEDAAEGETALYTVATGLIVMTGDVLLTRPDSAMTGEKLTVHVDDGTGRMEGRVTVIFTPEGGAGDGG
ncbi:MAG: lipopolysaccharide transport periplasmic protein LptA [Pseudomonadota bacterium]